VRSILAARCCIALAGVALVIPAGARLPAQPTKGNGWKLAGSLGLAQFVVVSEADPQDRVVYDQAIAALCPPQSTCFLRIFTNSNDVPLDSAGGFDPGTAHGKVPALRQAGKRGLRVKLPPRHAWRKLLLSGGAARAHHAYRTGEALC
jgi:hypothetical protein